MEKITIAWILLTPIVCFLGGFYIFPNIFTATKDIMVTTKILGLFLFGLTWWEIYFLIV